MAHGHPIEIREYKVVFTLRASQPPNLEIFNEEGRQCDTSDGRACFRLLELAVLVCPTHVKLATLPVDIAPGSAQDLTHATASEDSERNKQTVIVRDRLAPTV